MKSTYLPTRNNIIEYLQKMGQRWLRILNINIPEKITFNRQLSTSSTMRRCNILNQIIHRGLPTLNQKQLAPIKSPSVAHTNEDTLVTESSLTPSSTIVRNRLLHLLQIHHLRITIINLGDL